MCADLNKKQMQKPGKYLNQNTWCYFEVLIRSQFQFSQYISVNYKKGENLYTENIQVMTIHFFSVACHQEKAIHFPNTLLEYLHTYFQEIFLQILKWKKLDILRIFWWRLAMLEPKLS